MAYHSLQTTFLEIRHTGAKRKNGKDILFPRCKSPLTFAYPEINRYNQLPPSHILKIRFNIILTAMPRSFKFSLSLKFLHYNSVSTSSSSFLPHVLFILGTENRKYYNPHLIKGRISTMHKNVFYVYCNRKVFSDTNFTLLPGETRTSVRQTTKCI